MFYNRKTCLVKISEYETLSGIDRKVSIVKASSKPDVLKNEMIKILKNAMACDTVEFINGYEKDEFDIDDFDMLDMQYGIEIDYIKDGNSYVIYTRDIYELTDEAPKRKYKRRGDV